MRARGQGRGGPEREPNALGLARQACCVVQRGPPAPLGRDSPAWLTGPQAFLPSWGWRVSHGARDPPAPPVGPRGPRSGAGWAGRAPGSRGQEGSSGSQRGSGLGLLPRWWSSHLKSRISADEFFLHLCASLCLIACSSAGGLSGMRAPHLCM